MIKVYPYQFGKYNQKLIMNGKKIKDLECNCRWAQCNKNAWKEGNVLCCHLRSVILHHDLKMKKYGRKI